MCVCGKYIWINVWFIAARAIALDCVPNAKKEANNCNNNKDDRAYIEADKKEDNNNNNKTQRE